MEVSAAEARVMTAVHDVGGSRHVRHGVIQLVMAANVVAVTLCGDSAPGLGEQVLHFIDEAGDAHSCVDHEFGIAPSNMPDVAPRSLLPSTVVRISTPRHSLESPQHRRTGGPSPFASEFLRSCQLKLRRKRCEAGRISRVIS